MPIPVPARIAQCRRNVVLNGFRKCGVIAIKYKRRFNVADIESQHFLHDPEATARQTLIVFNLIAPKFLRPIPIEEEVGKRFVVPQDLVIFGIENGMKCFQNIVSAFLIRNGVGRSAKIGGSRRRYTLYRAEESVKELETTRLDGQLDFIKYILEDLMV